MRTLLSMGFTETGLEFVDTELNEPDRSVALLLQVGELFSRSFRSDAPFYRYLMSYDEVVDVYAATDALAANRREPEADRIAGQLGPDVVSGPPALASTPAIAIVAAVATIALTAALLAGRGWARFALVGLGIVTGVVLAWDGRLHAVAVFVLVAVAAVASVLPSAHRFLAAPDAR